MSIAFNLETGLDLFWKPPAHTLGTSNPFVSIIVSIVMLFLFTISLINKFSSDKNYLIGKVVEVNFLTSRILL